MVIEPILDHSSGLWFEQSRDRSINGLSMLVCEGSVRMSVRVKKKIDDSGSRETVESSNVKSGAVPMSTTVVVLFASYYRSSTLVLRKQLLYAHGI